MPHLSLNTTRQTKFQKQHPLLCQQKLLMNQLPYYHDQRCEAGNLVLHGLLKANQPSGSKYGAAEHTRPVNTDLEICHEEETQSRRLLHYLLLRLRPCLCINKQRMEILIMSEGSMNHESHTLCPIMIIDGGGK